MDKLNNISKFIASTLGDGGNDNVDNTNNDGLAAAFTATGGAKELDEDCVYDPTSYANDDDDIVLKEYGYKYDEGHNNGEEQAIKNDEYECDDDDDDDNDDPLATIENQKDLQRLLPIHKPTAVITKRQEKIPYVFVLGQTYHPITQYYERKQYESSLFWFTYRHNFPEIRPYGITTDAGWGCMLRSAQMLLAHTLRVHFQSKFWKPSKSLSKTRTDPDTLTLSLMRWFADFPSKTESIYSLHNMVAAGLAKYETLPGEWYGPNKVSYVLRDLVELHSKTQPSLFRVHVCSEGTIYKDQIHQLMTRDSKRRADERQKSQQQQQPPPVSTQPSHPLEDPFVGASAAASTAGAAPSYSQNSSQKSQQQIQQPIQIENLEWDTSLLLLIPLRLGLNKFNEEYTLSLARSFWLPQSVGVLGGRPRGARWFFGSYADGSRVLGLDPHTIQGAPKKKKVRRGSSTNKNASSSCWEIDMTDDYLRSVHTPYPELYQILKMDPSIAIGYYCRTKKEFMELEKSFQEIKDANPELPDMFTFVDVAPDYSRSTSFSNAAIAAVAGDSSILSDTTTTDHQHDDDLLGGDGGKIEESDDEDEYVLL